MSWDKAGAVHKQVKRGRCGAVPLAVFPKGNSFCLMRFFGQEAGSQQNSLQNTLCGHLLCIGTRPNLYFSFSYLQLLQHLEGQQLLPKVIATLDYD